MSLRKLVLSALVIAMVLALAAEAQAWSRRGYYPGMVNSYSYESPHYRTVPSYRSYNPDYYEGYNRYPTGYYTYGPGYNYNYESRRRNRTRNVVLGVGAAVLLGTALRNR